MEDYEPIKFDFSNKDLMAILQVEEKSVEENSWKLYFDGVSTTLGHIIGDVLISQKGNIAHSQQDWISITPTTRQNIRRVSWAYRPPWIKRLRN